MFDEMSLMVMTYISQSVPAVTLMKQLQLKNNLHLTTTNSILCIFSMKHNSYSKSVYIYIFIIAAMGQYLANSPDLNPRDSCAGCVTCKDSSGFLALLQTVVAVLHFHEQVFCEIKGLVQALSSELLPHI